MVTGVTDRIKVMMDADNKMTDYRNRWGEEAVSEREVDSEQGVRQWEAEVTDSTISIGRLILTKVRIIREGIKLKHLEPLKDSLMKKTNQILTNKYGEKNRSAAVVEAAAVASEEEATTNKETNETLPKWLRFTTVRNTTSILNNYPPEKI